MGCPDKAVVKNGCGGALINNRELAKDIIEATRRGAGGHFPVSVKTRVGFTTADLSWIEFLLKLKLNMLTIHLRTVKEMSKVPAHWDLMEQIVKLKNQISPTTLLVGNGDVESKSQGKELAKRYSLDGIMIGRGVFNDPYIFNKNSSWQSMSKDQKINLYKKHVNLFMETYHPNHLNYLKSYKTLNKFCKIYIQGFAGAKEIREELMNTTSVEDLTKKLNKL
jgi:tRNA-dihydrouridine synthase